MIFMRTVPPAVALTILTVGLSLMFCFANSGAGAFSFADMLLLTLPIMSLLGSVFVTLTLAPKRVR